MGKVWNFPHIGWYEVNETFEINVELSLYDVGGGVTLLSRFNFDAFPSVPGGPEQWENGQMNTVSQ